jgi:hypothetical protein
MVEESADFTKEKVACNQLCRQAIVLTEDSSADDFFMRLSSC